MADKAFNPLQLKPEEFTQFVDQLSTPAQGATTSTSPAAQGLAPAALNALAEASLTLGQLRDDVISEDTRKMGVRPGVFLDISKGAPASVRYQLGFDQNQLNQFKRLNQIYGVGNVDLSEEGRFILRNQPTQSGGVEDVMVDPVGLEGGDVVELATQAGPIVAGFIGAKLGLRGANRFNFGPAGKVVSGVTGMAAAGNAAGFTQDALARAIQGSEINVSEIAKQRAAQALFDEALGFAFAGGAKAASKTIEGILGLGQIPVGTTATREASKTLKAQTGVEFPLTPGQEADSRLLLRLEAMTGERMGSAAALDRVRAAQAKAESELRRVFLGLPRTMSDDDLKATLPQADIVGQKGLGRLGAEALRLEGDVAKAAQAVGRAGTAEAQLLSGTTLGTPLNTTQVGQAARQRAVADFDAFHSTMGQRYEQFLSKPEVQARIVPGRTLANEVAQVEKKLTPQALKEKPTGLVTPSGAPATAPQLETLEAFVPAKVRSFIDTLKGLNQARVSVNDLKQVRTSIRNAVKEGIAIPGTDVTQLRTLEGAVDDAITKGLSGMSDTTLLPEWQKLTADYAKGIQRFDKVGIREMLVKEGERGAVGDTELAESIMGNTGRALDNFNNLEAFFGAASAEFEGMKAAARQRIMVGALDDLTGYINGQALRSRLKDVRPEVAEKLFGTNKEELHRIGEALSKSQGNLDTKDLVKLGQSKTLTAQKVVDLVEAENARTVAYNNKLIRAAARGLPDAEVIQPSEFVRHATKMDPGDASKVMGILSDRPELVQEIRQLAIEDIWGRVQAGAVGKERVSSKLLQEAMTPQGKPVQEQTWRVILGNETVNALESFIKVADPREFGAQAFKTAGAIGAGMEVPRLFMRGEIAALPEIASRFLVGFLYSGPLKRSVTNLLTSNDRSRVLNAVIASTPFIDAVTERFGSDGAFGIMTAMREMVEPEQERSLAIEGKVPTTFDPRTLPPDQYKQWLDRHLRQ